MKLEIIKIYNRIEYSFLAVFQVSVSEVETSVPEIFVVKDIPIEDVPQLSSTSGSSSSSETLGMGSSSSMMESSSSECLSSSSSIDQTPSFVIYPQRVLISVASLTDLITYPTTSPGDNELYRASTVAM
ncbi:MAG: hypothetical protein ACXABY_37270, partial [Candidatus Thorarchaeota archaeon]